MNEVKCKYWIVSNDDEKRKVLEILGRSSIENLNYEYPYIIGQEKSFVFQQDDIEELSDFEDTSANEIYTYHEQGLTLV